MKLFKVILGIVVVLLSLLISCSYHEIITDSASTSQTLSYNNISTQTNMVATSSPVWTGQDFSQAITYSISPSTTGISINPSNGVITVASNTATQSATIYTVTATSGGINRGSITATLTIEVRLSFLTSITNISDDNNLLLAGVISMATAELGGNPYLFIAGNNDNGVSAFSVDNNGKLNNVTNVSDDDNMLLNGATSVTTTQVSGNTYLFVTGQHDNGLSVFSVSGDGNLNNVTNVSNDVNLNLSNAVSTSIAQVSGNTYLFVAGSEDNGLSVFSVSGDGSLNNVTNVNDDANLNLSNVSFTTTAQVSGNTYLFTGGSGDSGVSVFSVSGDGSLSHVHKVNDDDTLHLGVVVGITTATVGTTTYLFTAGFGDHGVSVFSVGSGGNLNNVYNVSNNTTLALRNVTSLATHQIGGNTYLFAAGLSDHGVSVFSVGSDGSLVNVANVYDNDNSNALKLLGAISVSVLTLGTETYLYVAGTTDNGISVFLLSP